MNKDNKVWPPPVEHPLEAASLTKKRHWEWPPPGFCYAVMCLCYYVYTVLSWAHTDIGLDSSTSDIDEPVIISTVPAAVVGLILSAVDFRFFRHSNFRTTAAWIGLIISLLLVPLITSLDDHVTAINRHWVDQWAAGVFSILSAGTERGRILTPPPRDAIKVKD